MRRESDPFIGPTWAKLLFGWAMLVAGGLLALVSVVVLVGGIVLAFWAEARLRAGMAMIAFWAAISGMLALTGWQVLRAPTRPPKGKGPRGAVWVTLGGLAMIPLLWVLSGTFLGSRPLNESVAYVTPAWWLLFLLSFPVMKRYQAARGSPIWWWEWGLVLGVLAGSAAGLEIFLVGRGLGLSLVGGLVIGAVFFATIGGYFLWWEKVGRSWYLEQGGRLRWPLS